MRFCTHRRSAHALPPHANRARSSCHGTAAVARPGAARPSNEVGAWHAARGCAGGVLRGGRAGRGAGVGGAAGHAVSAAFTVLNTANACMLIGDTFASYSASRSHDMRRCGGVACYGVRVGLRAQARLQRVPRSTRPGRCCAARTVMRVTTHRMHRGSAVAAVDWQREGVSVRWGVHMHGLRRVRSRCCGARAL